MKQKKGLRKKLLSLELVSFLVITAVIVVVGVVTVSKSITRQEYQKMKGVTALVQSQYDAKYPGVFGIKLLEDGSYQVYKGDAEITKDYSIIDEVKDSFGYEVTLFCKNIRVQTTLKSADGERYLSTKAPTLVTAKTIDGKEESFFKDVKVGKEKQFAYYKPLLLEDGTVYGMIGISCSSADVKAGVLSTVLPLVGICIGLAIVFSLLSIRYITKMVDPLVKLNAFTNDVAKGNFNTDIPASILQREDEIGALARDGKAMQKAIRVLVEYDALTKLRNRRYGEKRLCQVVGNAPKVNANFCAAIGDIDFFKKINDIYGHEAGDKVLQEVSKILKEHMSGKGFVARWGGEEFLLVFERATLEEAEKLAEGILDAIRGHVLIYREKEISVTMSMGIAKGIFGEEPDSLLKRADDFLYQAKEGGRDQICKG